MYYVRRHIALARLFDDLNGDLTFRLLFEFDSLTIQLNGIQELFVQCNFLSFFLVSFFLLYFYRMFTFSKLYIFKITK